MEFSQLVIYQEELLETMRKAEKNFKKTPKERIKPAYVETRLEMLEQLWKEFRDGHREIIAMSSKTNKDCSYFNQSVYDKCEEIYIQYKTTLKEIIQTYINQQSSTSVSMCDVTKSITNECEVKLPRIHLPTFTGKYEEWQTFFDMFTTLIHNNKSLSLVQKLQYLKSNLTGEPQTLIQTFSTTEANYEEAWNQLVRRYNNKRYNCNAVLKHLFAQKKIISESPSAVKQLLDNTTSSLTSLKNMGVNIDSWDILIVYITVSKLDGESIKQWEQKLSSLNDELPSWSQLRGFMETRFRSMEMIDCNTYSRVSQQIKSAVKHKSFHTFKENRYKGKCAICKQDHYIYGCGQFRQMSVKERQEYIQQNKLCFNCLAPSHAVIKCRQRTSCGRCGRRHHTLLHFDAATSGDVGSSAPSAPTSEQRSSEEISISANFSKGSEGNTVLLATASINVRAKNTCKYVVRALVDQGSQASFITEDTVQLLGLVRKPVSGWVSGLGDSRTKIKYVVSIPVEACNNHNKLFYINAYVLRSLTSFLPAVDVEPLEWRELDNLPLADYKFNISGKIDLLIGAEIYSEIILDGVLKHPTKNIIAQNTVFGWILSGKISRNLSNTSTKFVGMHINLNTEDEVLKLFWEMENEPQNLNRQLTESEKQCEEYFNKTTTRDREGRYIVKLPFSTENPKCSYNNSKEIALKRLQLLEKRLLKNVELRKEYTRVMNEYIILNHISEIPDNAINNKKSVYLPHHAVVREDKTTTKVRVVFDASCKGDNNISLNDELLVGPKLQQDLRHILMRWRVHKIVLVADIEKMYRMVRVAEDDTEFQRIMWRAHPDDPIKHFKF